MKLAIISDTHMPKGERRLPDACLERLAAADAILHAGDIITLEVLRELEAIGPPVHAVAGNVDEAEVHGVLPERRTVVVDIGVVIGMIHDAGPNAGRLNRLRRVFPTCEAVIFGHSHHPVHLTDDTDGFQILNPGSPTERRRSPRHTMAMGEMVDGRFKLELVDLPEPA